MVSPVSSAAAAAARQPGRSESDDALEAVFQESVGGIFFGQLVKSLRATQGKPAYLHGGRAEELFQGQLDQEVVKKLSTEKSGPFIHELFQQFLNVQDRQKSLQEAVAALQSAASPDLSQFSQLEHPLQQQRSGITRTPVTTVSEVAYPQVRK